MKNNKGITILSLIVTVIIMLILVVITINLTNDGGAITKTKEAVKATQLEADREELGLAVFASTDYSLGEISNLEDNLSEGWDVVTNDDGTFECTSPKGNLFTVEANGNIIDGEKGNEGGGGSYTPPAVPQ